MKKLLLVLAVTLAASPLAGAGGWATVGLGSLPPSGLTANEAWPVEITVLQHGRTPLAGVTPVVRVRDDGGKLVRSYTAAPTSEAGVYRAVVRFPAEGSFTYEVHDGFGTYGGAQTHTFAPVTIGGPGSAFPYLPVALAAGLVLVLAAAAAFALRRRPDRTPAPALREAA